jgi:hypothetical protein
MDTRFWDQLLPLLEENRVIPVVGRDLLVIDAEGERRHLYEHLARRLARRFGLPEPLPATLNELACRYLAERQALEDIYPALKRELARLEELPAPQPIVELAEIGWFRLYVSTTFDDFLCRAVDAARHDGARLTHSLAYALNNDFQDLPEDFANLQRPAVYQLLGRASAIQDTYAVTDEDLLEFVHNLQMPERRPRRLFDALAANHVLLIGGGFSPWVIRFFLRAVKHRERLWQVRGRAGFLVDATAQQDPDLVQFLHHYSDRTLVYQSGGALEFVHELSQLWRQEHAREHDRPAAAPGAARSEPMPRHAVFLSYASEDRAIVERVKSQLDAAGIDAWFDRSELQAGAGWSEEISANIDSAAAFVPVISKSVLGRGSREFRVEWERALKARERRPREASGGAARFIVPIVIDGTDMQAAGVREYFGGTQAVSLPGGAVSDEFRAAMRDLVRARQLAH